eukprot:1150986-Pelagomonas_calceolata.AAC.1
MCFWPCETVVSLHTLREGCGCCTTASKAQKKELQELWRSTLPDGPFGAKLLALTHGACEPWCKWANTCALARYAGVHGASRR